MPGPNPNTIMFRNRFTGETMAAMNNTHFDIDFTSYGPDLIMLINGQSIGRIPRTSNSYTQDDMRMQVKRLLTEIEKKYIIDVKTENLSDVEKIITQEVQNRLKKIIKEVVDNGYKY